MGRSYYVDETVEKYLKALQQNKSFVTGLLIGQCSLQRDYVVLAVQTPQKEDQQKVAEQKDSSQKFNEIDEEWFCIHAKQVSRMLPGGLLLIGVFIVTPPDLSKESPNVLRKLIFAAEKFGMRSRCWNYTEEDVMDRVALQICSTTKKILCRTYDVKDPKSTAKPADWKYQSTPLSWLTIDCSINVDLNVQLPSSATYKERQTSTRNALAQWTKDVEASTILFNGQLKDIDGELMDEQKKSKSSAHSSSQIVSVTVLTSSDICNRSTARVQVSKSSLNIQGIVKCRGYICNNKPKVREALQVIKRDILNTVSDRCEVLFEDIILNGPHQGSEKALCPLPRRVLVPLLGSNAKLCDYVFGDETKEDLENRFLEMLDQEIQYGDLEFLEEKNITVNEKEQQACESHYLSSGETCAVKKEISSSHLHHSAGFAIAVVVILLAILISFIYLKEE
ncbi:protein odr-4 homolog [Hyperolius riggenbachi]|uniref:protein odr-4 homolog n=1 Tax=Hyperolius riggenbachi TaxID=752182 RepID=UPI0035A39265